MYAVAEPARRERLDRPLALSHRWHQGEVEAERLARAVR
jgi:hypothetical protein